MRLSKKRTNRKYDASFKEDVIKMISSGRPILEISESLGVSGSLLRRWYKASNSIPTGKNGTQSSGLHNNLIQENERLTAALRRSEQERDILKKALGIFSRGI